MHRKLYVCSLMTVALFSIAQSGSAGCLEFINSVASIRNASEGTVLTHMVTKVRRTINRIRLAETNNHRIEITDVQNSDLDSHTRMVEVFIRTSIGVAVPGFGAMTPRVVVIEGQERLVVLRSLSNENEAVNSILDIYDLNDSRLVHSISLGFLGNEPRIGRKDIDQLWRAEIVSIRKELYLIQLIRKVGASDQLEEDAVVPNTLVIQNLGEAIRGRQENLNPPIEIPIEFDLHGGFTNTPWDYLIIDNLNSPILEISINKDHVPTIRSFYKLLGESPSSFYDQFEMLGKWVNVATVGPHTDLLFMKETATPPLEIKLVIDLGKIVEGVESIYPVTDFTKPEEASD